MNPIHTSIISLLCFVFAGTPFDAAAFDVSPAISSEVRIEDSRYLGDSLLTIDASGNHHLVYVDGVPAEPATFLIYESEKGLLPLYLNNPTGVGAQQLQAITTTKGDVLLMTYAAEGSSEGCFLYHLNGPTPEQPRFVVPTTEEPQAVMVPMEDGGVLVVTLAAAQINIGRLIPRPYNYEALGSFPVTAGAGPKEFTAISAFVEPDQTIHLVATTNEEIDSDAFRSQLLHRRFELNNFALGTPWQIVASGLAESSTTEIAAMHAVAVATETIIVYVDGIADELRSARVTSGGWEIETIQDSADIDTLIIAPDELGTLRAAWNALSPFTAARYRTFDDSGWGSVETVLSLFDSSASFATDHSGYLHLAVTRAVIGPGEVIENSYRSFRPRDITDADHDGLSYVLEDLLGTDPDTPNFDTLTFDMSSSFRASLSAFARGDLARVDESDTCFHSATSDIVLKIEYSSDLALWREAITQVDTDLFQITNRGTFLSTTFKESALETPRKFMRLKATRNR
ncbi:hypothetical protein V2O64_24365 (plasmid) [Verrucomicrobiaceae bacterium 227]